jgi:hypothetical protein
VFSSLLMIRERYICRELPYSTNISLTISIARLRKAVLCFYTSKIINTVKFIAVQG